VIHFAATKLKTQSLAKKLKFGFRQSERLTGFERLGEHLKPFLVQNKVLAKI
jgi:hypothetical protein